MAETRRAGDSVHVFEFFFRKNTIRPECTIYIKVIDNNNRKKNNMWWQFSKKCRQMEKKIADITGASGSRGWDIQINGEINQRACVFNRRIGCYLWHSNGIELWKKRTRVRTRFEKNRI